MANLTNIIGGQPYYDAAGSNSKSLLDFWKGTQNQYDDGTSVEDYRYLLMPVRLTG